MELKDRFFGRGYPVPGGPSVANARMKDPPGFAALFAAPPELDPVAITEFLRGYHPELAGATAEFLRIPPQPGADPAAPPTTIGLIGWGRHVVKVVAFDSPMPPGAVDRAVRPAHYDPALKDEATAHAAHALLFYAGYELDVFEQHVALAAAAAGLAAAGALVVLNETARTSVPAVVLLPHAEDDGDTLATLRTFPLPLLYAGFVKMEVEGEEGVWMRTHGCNVLGLPDLALRADGHHQSTATFNLFANLLAYLRQSGKTFAPGDTMNVGEGMYLRLRERAAAEWFLEGEGPLLVAERISPEEANRETV